MKKNNIKHEIENFLKTFAIEETEETSIENQDWIIDNPRCIKYEDRIFYIPEDCSLMDDNDSLLKDMLLATFIYE